MECSADRVGHPGAESAAERPSRPAGWSAAANDEERLPFALLAVLVGEIAAFAALAASGNMPGIVTVLYRALLTL